MVKPGLRVFESYLFARGAILVSISSFQRLNFSHFRFQEQTNADPDKNIALKKFLWIFQYSPGAPEGTLERTSFITVVN